MRKIAITLVHNKGDKGNIDQVEKLKELLVLKEDLHDEYNEAGEVVGQYTTYHQEFKNLNFEHEVKVYQVVPYGVEPPPNRYDINSGGIVQYGEGDNDKTGNHPRFFNWGAKRGMDQGAEISLYVEDVSRLNMKLFKAKLLGKLSLQEESFGKAISKEEFSKGQLKEDRELSVAVSEKLERVRKGGLA